MFRKKYTTVPESECSHRAEISLKGSALLCAIATGLVREIADGNGYDIGPFLRFWDEFVKLI